MSGSAGSRITGSRSCHIECLELAESTVVSKPESRMDWMTGYLDGWNAANDFRSNGDAVNFFMGSYDENGELSDFYNMTVYDEDTKIFTEPVTGAQYQTSGWVYDYLTRSYDIALESGTFLIGDTDITQIICLYADDFVRIGYYDAEGALVQEDQYAYVMVSQSPCALEGHNYSVENVKDATCTAMGERKYTCSVCGDTKVEDVPMKDHRSSFTVFKEATCTDSGIGLYTCADCGTQYTDDISALGHDWLATESVDSAYSLPTDVDCPECDSIDFSSALDRESAIYTCTCHSCGAEWLESAQVTYGYTTYTCSRCGAYKTERLDEVDNGLFTSIGNFFADGIRWCTDKLTQFVDSLTGMLDTFNEYLAQIGEYSSSYPSFLGQIVGILPEDMMAVIWFVIVAAVVVAVIKFWFR